MPTFHISSSLFASFSQHKALQAPQPTPSPTLPTLEEDKPAGTPSLLPGKQDIPPVPPPRQARAHRPLSSRASKTRPPSAHHPSSRASNNPTKSLPKSLPSSPPGQAKTLGPSSSRAGKASQPNLLPGKQDLALPRPSSRASKNLTQEPSSRASRNARSIFLPGKQELRPRISSRGSKNLGPKNLSSRAGKHPARAPPPPRDASPPAASALPRLACPGRVVGTPSARKTRPRRAGTVGR
jgi:hypothetical protein